MVALLINHLVAWNLTHACLSLRCCVAISPLPCHVCKTDMTGRHVLCFALLQTDMSTLKVDTSCTSPTTIHLPNVPIMVSIAPNRSSVMYDNLSLHYCLVYMESHPSLVPYFCASDLIMYPCPNDASSVSQLPTQCMCLPRRPSPAKRNASTHLVPLFFTAIAATV